MYYKSSVLRPLNWAKSTVLVEAGRNTPLSLAPTFRLLRLKWIQISEDLPSRPDPAEFGFGGGAVGETHIWATSSRKVAEVRQLLDNFAAE